MFRPTARKTLLGSLLSMGELIFHASVRSIRKSHGNAVVGLLVSIAQSVVGIGVMYMLFWLMGNNQAPVRGDRMLYIMSGIFSFMTHTKAIGAVQRADGPTAAMMKHTPMNTLVSTTAAAIGALYMQTVSAGVILFGYHVLIAPISIDEPQGVLVMYLMAWISGCSIGLIFRALTPWAPDFFSVVTTAYQRANMVFSGKMFLANVTPLSTLKLFMWNPLFHIIDQTRGFMFLNYEPRYSSFTYPFITTAVLFMIGMLGERFTASRVSASWNARR